MGKKSDPQKRTKKTGRNIKIRSKKYRRRSFCKWNKWNAAVTQESFLWFQFNSKKDRKWRECLGFAYWRCVNLSSRLTLIKNINCAHCLIIIYLLLFAVGSFVTFICSFVIQRKIWPDIELSFCLLSKKIIWCYLCTLVLTFDIHMLILMHKLTSFESFEKIAGYSVY